MNQEIKNELVDNASESSDNADAEIGVDIDIDNMDVDVESDVDSDIESDESEDEFFEEIYSELLEAINRNAEHLKLLQKSFQNLKLELFDSKNRWFQKFFKEIEVANDTIEQVEEELYEFSN